MLTLSGATLIVARRFFSLPRIIFDVWSPWLSRVRYVKHSPNLHIPFTVALQLRSKVAMYESNNSVLCHYALEFQSFLYCRSQFRSRFTQRRVRLV